MADGEVAAARAAAPPAGGPLLASGPLRINVVVAGAAICWLLAELPEPRGPQLIGWLPVHLAAATSAYACWRLLRTPGLPAPVRRFWRQMFAAMVLIGAAGGSNAYDAVDGPGAPTQLQRPLTTVLFLAAVTCVAWAVLWLPIRSSGRQLLTMGLDLTIVVVSAGLLGYHIVVSTSDQMRANSGSSITIVGVLTLGFAAMLALSRVALTGAGPLNRQSLWALGGTLLGGVVGGALAPYLQPWPHLQSTQQIVPLCCVGITLAAALQGRGGAATARTPTELRRRFSILPYLAIVVTDAFLLVVSAEAAVELRIFITGSVVLAVAVVARQMLVFADHERLLARLDASLLELSRHEQRFRSLVQNSSDVITITDPAGNLIYASPGLERLIGDPVENWTGRSLLDIVHPGDADAIQRAMETLGLSGATARSQVRVRHVDGGWRCLEIVSTNRVDDPSVGGVVSNIRDVTETRVVQDQLAHQATHDALTGLANRTLFSRETERAVRMADGYRSDLLGTAIVLVDLDDFKAINDHLGHGVGDALLLSVAARLRGCVRPGDLVARLGGDEFAVLLWDVPPPVATRIAESIIATLSVPVSAAGHDLLVQASIGLARQEPGCDADELLRRADVAMYAAKEMGKGCHAEYRHDLDAHAVEHARLAAELRQAIDHGELRLIYQPIVSLPDGRLIGVEALVRWYHPERGEILPNAFIPVAERTGLVVPLGAWVLYEACRQAAEWQRTLGPAAPGRISVNVSVRQLVERSFAQIAAAALHTVGLPADRLIVEITETAVFNGGRALDTVRELHDLGVKIALDDFGTGHSSLGLLRTCPVDVLKVDKSFVDGVTGTVEQEAIATSISQIARAMRLEAVAEGVETASQAQRLYRLGYRLAQGFHFSRPVSAEEITRRCAGTALTPVAQHSGG